MQFSAAGYFEGFRGVGLFHAERDVGVQFPKQPVADMTAGDIFPFLSGKGGIVDDKVHGDSRLGNLLEGNRSRILGGTESIADVDIRDAGDGDDGPDTCFLHIDFI